MAILKELMLMPNEVVPFWWRRNPLRPREPRWGELIADAYIHINDCTESIFVISTKEKPRQLWEVSSELFIFSTNWPVFT